MVDYNSDFGGPLGGVNFSASKLFSFTRKSSTLKWRNHEHLEVLSSCVLI